MRQIVKISPGKTWMGWLVWLLIIASRGYAQVLPNVPPSTIPDGYVVPFQFDINTLPIPVVRLRINGHEPMSFAVDTGSAAPLLVFPRYARKLELTRSDKSPNVLLGEAAMPRVQMLGKLGVPPISFRPSMTMIMDIPFIDAFGSKAPIVGIVGWHLLKDHIVSFDFAAKTLTFYTKSLPASQTTDAQVLPLQWDMPAISSLLWVPVRFGSGEATRCIVDTGRVQTLVFTEALSRLKPLGAEEGSGASLQGDYTTVAMLLPDVQLGSFKEPDVIVDAAGKEPGSILGMELLSRFRLTLDFPHRQMLLQRAANYKELLRLQGDEVVYCKQEQGQWQVAALKLWTTATSSGLQAGDKIVSIDGITTEGHSYLEVRSLLCGYAGTTATLVVEREGNQCLNITYLRQRRFASDTPLGTGMGCSREVKTGRLFIKTLCLNSPLLQAGAQVNDEIVKINDRDVRTSSSEELHAETKKSEGTQLTFLIQRKGEEKPRLLQVRVSKLQQ